MSATLGKHPVWKHRKEIASDNISVKISVMRHFVSNGIPWLSKANGDYVRENKTGARLLDFFPTSETEFAKWSTEKRSAKFSNCQKVIDLLIEKGMSFTSHGPDTLKTYNNIKLREQANSLFGALKVQAKRQVVGEKPVAELDKLKEELNYWKVFSKTEGQYVIDAIKEHNKYQRKIKDLTRSLAESKNVIKEVLDSKDKEISSRDAEIALLKKQLKEVRTFREVKD